METDSGQAMAVANELPRHTDHAKYAGGESDLTIIKVSVSQRLCQCLRGEGARGEERRGRRARLV